MVGQLLKEPFLLPSDAKKELNRLKETGLLSSFGQYIPNLWDNLLRLKYPLDVWITRDIIYNGGKEFESKLSGFMNLEVQLGKAFIRDLYSELGKYSNVARLLQKLSSLSAEQACALKLVEAGATDLRKCLDEKFKDITFTLQDHQYFVSVKHKQEEFSTQNDIEEALFGKMHEPQSHILRRFKSFDVSKLLNITDKVRDEIIEYIHCNLNKDLQEIIDDGEGFQKQYVFGQMEVDIVFESNEIYLSLSNATSKIEIILRESNDTSAVVSVVAFWDGGSPSEQLLFLLSEQVRDYDKAVKAGYDASIIQWMQVDLHEQYESFINSGNDFFRDWANRYTFPIVLALFFRFPFDTGKHNWYIANNEAMNYSFIKNIVKN